MATQLDLLIDMLEELNREVMELKKAVIPFIPLPRQARPILSRTVEMTDPLLADAYFGTVREVIQSVEDAPSNLRSNLIEPVSVIAGTTRSNFRENVVEPVTRKPAQARKPRTPAQRRNDKLQSRAFKAANDALRKNNGGMRKGVDQKMIARRAQKELKKLKKSAGTKKGQIRKTARRAFKR